MVAPQLARLEAGRGQKVDAHVPAGVERDHVGALPFHPERQVTARRSELEHALVAQVDGSAGVSKRICNGSATSPAMRDGFITSNVCCCSFQSYTVPSSRVWIASVTRYVPSSNGMRSNANTASPSPSAAGTSTPSTRVF